MLTIKELLRWIILIIILLTFIFVGALLQGCIDVTGEVPPIEVIIDEDDTDKLKQIMVVEIFDELDNFLLHAEAVEYRDGDEVVLFYDDKEIVINISR